MKKNIFILLIGLIFFYKAPVIDAAGIRDGDYVIKNNAFTRGYLTSINPSEVNLMGDQRVWNITYDEQKGFYKIKNNYNQSYLFYDFESSGNLGFKEGLKTTNSYRTTAFWSFDEVGYENNRRTKVVNINNIDTGNYNLSRGSLHYDNMIIGLGKLNVGNTMNNVLNKWVLYPQFPALQYDVVYNANTDNFSGKMDVTKIEEEQNIRIQTSGYTKEGYTFSHWTTTPEDIEANRLNPGDYILESDLNKDDAKINLYAQWKPINYYIQYNDTMQSGKRYEQNSLANLPSYDQKMVYDKEDTLLPIKFEKTGYSNRQWIQDSFISYENGALVKNLASKEGAAVNLYTDWRPHVYEIEFDANGGMGDPMGVINATYDNSVQLPKETFTKNNYVFTGWSTDKTSKEPEFKSQESIKNLTSKDGDIVTLYAIWEKEEAQNYTIKYEANVEDMSTVSGHMEASIVPINTDFSILDSEYSVEGYTFSHWTKTREDNENDRLYPGNMINNLGKPGEEITLYAQWEPIQYVIKYNDTDMSGFKFNRDLLADLPSYEQDMIYDKEDHLLPLQFEKPGYTNRQWQQTELISYANLALVKNLASNEGDLVDLYTNWRAHAYEIVFDANGGTGEPMGKVSAKYDESVQLPKETFIRKNYVFTGWSTDKTSKEPEFKSQESIKNLTTNDGEIVTLYAIWQKDRMLNAIE